MNLEPTPQAIKDQRIYAQWGLTDEEYRMISDTLDAYELYGSRPIFRHVE